MAQQDSSLVLNVNLDEIDPINQKRLLAFINQFVHDTVVFLNEFSRTCQERLMNLESKLRRAKDILALLEFKISSIPGLDVDQRELRRENSKSDKTYPSNNDIISSTSESAEAKETEAHTDETEAPVNTICASAHPLYATFFKMVNVGVPRQAVKLKMSALGLDSSILDDPNAPIEAEYKEETQ